MPAEECLGKFFGIERAQVVEPFADTNPFDGNVELFLDADNHAAFGRAVKFG